MYQPTNWFASSRHVLDIDFGGFYKDAPLEFLSKYLFIATVSRMS